MRWFFRIFFGFGLAGMVTTKTHDEFLLMLTLMAFGAVFGWED
jgi:hypothetical protein